MDFSQITDAIVQFVRENQGWAPFIVAGLAFCESIAVLSFFVPSTVILVGVGALIGAVGLEFWPMWLGAAIGAVLGDFLSFWFGRHFKEEAFRMWPFNAYPAMVERGRTFFQRWGAWGLFIGRFFGPARAVVPLIAGVFGVPWVLFWAANLASAMVWAFVLLSPGAGLTSLFQ